MVLAMPARSPAYIAVSAERLTLCEVMLEFPNALLLKVEKFDESKGAYIFEVTEVLQGSAPKDPVKLALFNDGVLPKRLQGMKKGTAIVAFLGSPDNRSLIFADGGWFLTRPDQGWEKFAQFRDDFSALFAGTPEELANAVRTLTRGGNATVSVQPKGIEANSKLFVRYEADFPHRRWPARDPAAAKRKAEDVRLAFGSKSVAVRQQAVIELATLPDAEADLLKAARDPHAEVRLAAVVGLGQQPKLSKPAIELLTRALEDEDRFVCGFAAWALGRAGADAKVSVPQLLKALGDRNYDHDFRPHRAAEAAESILKLVPGTPQAAKAVEFFLTDRMLNDQRIDSEGTRTAAARALGRSGPAAKAALPELAKRLKDPLAATRIAAAEAIHLVGGDTAQRAAATKVLATEIATGEVATRIQALRATATVKETSLLLDVRKQTTDKDADVKRVATQTEQSLTK
jgi:HEAT repeat protein